MTREEAIRRYNEKHTGGVQKSTPSISALSREEAIARYDAKQASKSWETRIGSIASREWQPPEYESYIPEEYKGKYEDFEEGGDGFDTVAAELKHNYGITPDKLENMTDEEKKLVTYLYTQDEPNLFEKIFAVKSDDKEYVRYAKELEEELERRGIERAAYEAQRNDGFWDKVGTSIGSVGNRVLGTFEGVDAIADALSGREVDETPFYTTLSEVKRQGVSEDMSGVGKFLYDVGMSWGDSMAMTGIGMLSGNPTAAKAISLIGMGSQAMSSTIADSKRRGMSDLQAIGNGILAGGIEAATEMIGIDALFDTRAFRNAFGKYLVKNVGANAGEEALAEVLGTVSDALVGQDKSRFMAKVREYQAKGYNESGAAAMAVLSVMGDTALAGLSGALMGLGSGTVGGAVQNVALNTRDVREGRAIRGLANAGKDLYGAARTMDNDKRIAAALKKLGEASSDSRSEAKLTGRLDRLAAEEYGRRSLEEYMTPEEINEQIKQGGADALKYYESRDDYKRAYDDYAGKIDTAKRTAINAEASAAALMVAPAEYGKRYKGELREVFDKGLAQYGGKKYKYPLWFEIAVSMGRQSGSRGLEEMLKTLPAEDRRGVLTLDNATIAAAFNEGRRIAAEYAEEQNEADERKKAGEMAEESRRKATAAEIAKKSSEDEKNSSEAEDITDGSRDNVLISDEVQKAKLTNSQQSQLKKLKRLGRYLDGYTFVVQFGHEGGKLGSQNAFFDPTNRTIYVNIEAGRQYRMTGDSSVELYEAALEAAWTHEIGHAIRMDAPTRYAELRDFIRTRLYREGGFENAVEKRRAQYESALGREIGYEYAEEEVICNSLGALMTSERLLNELAGKHRSLFSRLWRAVTEFFKSVMRRMRGMDGDFTAKTEEQRIVERALLKERRRLEDMFVGAMREANEVSRATLALNDRNKTTSDNKVAKSAENENVRTTDESNTPEMAEKKPLTDTNSENVKVSEGKWSLSIGDGDTIVDIENTKDFLAIHNLTEKNLLDTLELGGFPMPSIAIIRGGQEHSKYGNISVVFGRETVDPKVSSYNKIYGSDAWTPTYPRIEYKANPKVAKRVSDKYYELKDKYGYDAVRAMYSYATELEDRMNGLKGEIGLLEELYDSTRMMQIYLLDSGKGRIETIQKEIRKEMTASEIEMNEFFIKELGTEFVDAFQTPPGASPFSYRRAYVENNEKRLKEVFSKYLIEKLGIEEDLVPNVLDAQRTGDYAKMLQNAYRYRHEGAVSIKTEDDSKATDEAIRKVADNEQYRDWIDSLFKGAQEKSGIRNSRDYYDSYGNSRSWEQLHYENTVDNVIRVMREQVETGGQTTFSGNSIWGVAAKEYKSVDEMKSNKERLKILPEEEYKAMAEELGGRLEEIAQSIKRDSESNIFIAIDEAMQLIVDCVRTCKSRNSMLAYLRRYNKKATEKTVDDIISLVRDISNMPTGYFEAKPRRAVNFSEIKMVELPSHVSEHLKEELTERNIPFEIYGETDEERKNAIDSLEGVRFSLKDEYDSEKAGIRDQLLHSQDELNRMPIVFHANVPSSIGSNKYEAGNYAIAELRKYGFQADRQDFGKIYFDEKDIRDAMNYLDTDAEKVSIIAVYRVLKRGIKIGEHGNHKLRGKHTITFAAPVELNGIRGNMAVVVNMRNNRYKVHRILMPDGSMFSFSENKKDTKRESQKGVPKGSLANATSFVSNPIIPESEAKINPSEEKSAKKILESKYSLRDEDYLSAVKRGDMETAQAMVNEAARAAGYTDKVYHGTPHFGFTVFDPRKSKNGFFTSDSVQLAYTYSGTHGTKNISSVPMNIDSMSAAQIVKALNRDNPYNTVYSYRIADPDNPTSDIIEMLIEDGNVIMEDAMTIGAARYMLKGIHDSGNYALYAKPGKQLVIDARGSHFSNIPDAYEQIGINVSDDLVEKTKRYLKSTDNIAKFARAYGYDSLKFANISDEGRRGESDTADVYVYFNPSDLKSADPVTYDDNGEVIPLSERFKTDNEDIRYSLRDRLEREELADRFDRIAETAAEREIVEKYKAEIEIADDAIDERRRVIKRLDEIEGKAGFGDERKRLRSELEHWNSVITGHDSRLFELEGFKPFRDMVERYEQALRERHARGGNDRFDESHMWISQAKYRELINRSRGEKFYTQKDAQVIEDKIYDMDKLSRSKRNKLVEALWQGMNAAKTEADVEGVIKSVGRRIFDEITREVTVENPELEDNAETLEYLSGYVQRLSFSEDMKEEIRHKYDEDGTRSFMGRWQNKHSDGRVVAADVFVTEFARENAGYEYLEDMTAADAMFEIDALYDRMKNTEKRVGAYDDMTAEELSDVRRSIEQTLREAFRDGGEMPLVAKKSVSTEAMITFLKNERDDAEAKVSEVLSMQRARLMLNREANSIRDMKRGTFDNANEVRGTRVMELLRELGKFEYRGTFSEKDVREKVRGLYAWYTSPEADAVLGARGKDNDAALTNLRSTYIEEMLKDISLGEGRLTANELYGLAKILAAFRNIAKNYNKVWRAGKWVDALQVAEKYIGVLKLSKELKGGDWFGKAAFRTYFDEFADPLSIVRRYDGYLEGGYFTDTFNMFREAAVNLEVTYSDVTKDYFEFFKKHKNYERDIQTRSVSIYGVDVPMKAAMSIYMMIRQDHALRGFVGQGVSFVGFNGEVQTARPLSVEAAIRFKIDAMARMAMEDYGLDEKTARANAESAVKDATWDSGNATISELRAAAEPTKAAIEAAMTSEDRELIAIIGRDMNGPLRELKRTTDLERLGFTNVMEDSLYFPIKRSGIAEKIETLAYRDELESVSNISANKSREKGARQALFADDILKVYTRHARAICTYATMQQSIDFYNRIYNTSLTGDPNDNVKVGAVASEVWGKKQSGAKVENNGHAAFFRELIQDIQKLRSSRDNFLNNLLGGLRGGAAVAGIGLNGKVLMSQWFSFAAAAHELDLGSLIKGGVMWVGKTRLDFMTPSGWQRLRELGAIVDEYCPLARIRNEDNYAYLAQGVIEKGEGANVKRRAKGALGDGIKKLQEWSMWGIGRMDRAVICSLFEACKAEAVTADAPLGSEDNLVEAGRRLTEIILNTQQNALATEKSRAMRSEQEIIKAMTMFSSDAMKSNSRMLDAIGEARALRKRLTMDGLTDAARQRLLARQKTVGKRVGKSVGVVMMNSVYMAALTLLFRWWRGKLEEDEKIFKSVALDVLTGMFGGLPLIRDIVDKLINGYDVSDSSLDVLTDFLGTVKTLTETVTKVITGDAEWGDVVRSLRKLAFAYAQIVGLPVRNVWNGICGVIDKFNPELAKMLNG